MKKTKILLFGASGFIGQNLEEFWGKQSNFDCFALHSKNCDLLNRDDVALCIQKISPDVIVHAAYDGVDATTQYNSQKMHRNLLMNENILLGSVALSSLKKILFFGSGLEYGVSEQPLTEKDVLQPRSPYATTKAMQTLLSLEIAREYGLPLMLLRPFNLFGPYDNKSLVYYLISSILQKKSISMTKGEQQRDFLFVKDLVTIIHKVICSEDVQTGEIYNIASGVSTLVSEISQVIFDQLQFTDKINFKPYGKYETWFQVADVDKLKSLIEFPVLHSLEEGISQTIEWVRNSQKKE